MLPTQPPMSVEDVLDKQDGVYLCIKDHNSVFLWVNDNFANLVGMSKAQLIGHRDDRAEHVAHDQQVMVSGKPLLNFHETIDIPTGDGAMRSVEIVTQKGLLRQPDTGEIIGITVCFALRYPELVDDGTPVPKIVPSQQRTPDAEFWIKQLGMTSAGVGGYFAAGAVADETIARAALPARFESDHRLYSSNYYLLQSPDLLQLHTLRQDELWFHHDGLAIRLHIFAPNGQYQTVDIGRDIEQGQHLQAVAPHGSWFGGEVLGTGFVLASCSLSPGYEAEDSSKPNPAQIAQLKAVFPEQEAIIERLTQ
ncbi:cupin domain-containing protein [Chitinibacter sp. FCG-7]|uniref:Cupin domain-containing protein n=1 Tax=Chitinibacter mangrovi TaxID=3153927 RepID=A0AAU7F9E5_9NEIS